MKKLKLEELGRKSVEAFRQMDKLPIILVADNIRSALNVGSFFRSSDAFGIEKIILCGVSPSPPHKEINKSAIGATKSMQWEYVANVEDALVQLKKDNYELIGIEQTNESVEIQEVDSCMPKIALIMGNEVDGISSSALPLLDRAIEIPQFGTKHSLNVAVCAGICLYHFTNILR